MRAYTAIRTWHGKSARVTVYLDGVEVNRAGGKRAERAKAVILADWSRPDREVTHPLPLYGLRADYDAALTEAYRLSTATTMRSRGRYGVPGYTLPITPATEAIAIQVQDDPNGSYVVTTGQVN